MVKRTHPIRDETHFTEAQYRALRDAYEREGGEAGTGMSFLAWKRRRLLTLEGRPVRPWPALAQE